MAQVEELRQQLSRWRHDDEPPRPPFYLERSELRLQSPNQIQFDHLAIKKIVRVSTPGLRRYVGYKNMPRVLNGLGIAILSTSKGVMTDKEARSLEVGGEVLYYVY